MGLAGGGRKSSYSGAAETGGRAAAQLSPWRSVSEYASVGEAVQRHSPDSAQDIVRVRGGPHLWSLDGNLAPLF
jgi:hypothetical protein